MTATWIAVAVVALSLLLLAWLASSVLRRLGPLRAAALGLQARAEQAMELQVELDDLQPKLLEMQLRAERVKAKLPRRRG